MIGVGVVLPFLTAEVAVAVSAEEGLSLLEGFFQVNFAMGTSSSLVGGTAGLVATVFGPEGNKQGVDDALTPTTGVMALSGGVLSAIVYQRDQDALLDGSTKGSWFDFGFNTLKSMSNFASPKEAGSAKAAEVVQSGFAAAELAAHGSLGPTRSNAPTNSLVQSDEPTDPATPTSSAMMFNQSAFLPLPGAQLSDPPL
jgi:hypothetical protein